MKIVVLTGSPNKKGTSNTLVNEFIQGATEKGHSIQKFDVPFLNIHCCIGCGHCRMDGPCVYQDDMPKILEEILSSDMIVLASPLYYFGFSSQIKKAIDRFYSQNSKIQNKQLKSAFIVTCWNSDNATMRAMEEHINTLINYLNFENKGTLLATGYGYIGSPAEEKYKKEAYRLGENL